MRVIGTAGHVGHGKSMTGTHPARLKGERPQEMTIDLGFAWMELPDGEEVGIVDVPGHRNFIRNVLTGVVRIDVASRSDHHILRRPSPTETLDGGANADRITICL